MSAAAVKIEEDSFGTFYDEDLKATFPVRRFTLKNSKNVTIRLINYGATITDIIVPDKNGALADVNLGFDNMEGYTKNWFNPYFGAIVGRVVNRTAFAKFTIKGFDKKIWETNVEDSKVTFSYVSKDGEEGYPGSLLVSASYSLNESNELLLEITATCTKPTPVNLTNHAYFNLAGHDKGLEGLKEHKVYINANSYTPAPEDAFIPTGEIKPVAGTYLDFTSPKWLRDEMPKAGIGFNNNYCVNISNPPTMTIVARVVHPPSGRLLEIYADKPALQFYTSNYLPTENELQGKGGSFYTKNGAFCLETQDYPDAANQPNFPTSVIVPGQLYKHNVRFHFGIQINAEESSSSCNIA
ncbi:Hypothetical predicted protein [Cloeon dipterum]|uniref:Aldose 1-epimerase n=1 Tax=Cloeon dipterum TaxID=197152 RepID=A0A8S1DY64_9INSE|nr:Hypothetical predicted protein [Cloeon dipterum]